MNVYDGAEKRIDETEALRPHKNILLYDMAEGRRADAEYYQWVIDTPVEELLSEIEIWVEETTDMAYYQEDDGDSEAWSQAQAQLVSNPSPYGFRDPGGRSALRMGDRQYACPTCKEPNKLSMADKNLGYQCDECADRAEGRFPG